jgi:hypothetical protein
MKMEAYFITALNENNDLVFADDSFKLERYFCPVCLNPVMLKKSGNTAPGSKRPHFAHFEASNECSFENILHKSFKLLFLRHIKNALDKQFPVNFSWHCRYCKKTHTGNLLKKTCRIVEDHALEGHKPDIAFFDEHGHLYAVIEISVKKYNVPTPGAIEYYDSHNIILLNYVLRSEDDLRSVPAKALAPDTVYFCVNPRCPKCRAFMLKEYFCISTTPCYRCGKPVNICWIENPDNYVLPSEFTPAEIVLAKKHRVLLQRRYSNALSKKYLAVICPHCGAFIGEYYLEDTILDKKCLEEYQTEQIGYACPFCD